MTISTTTARISYTADGATAVFAFPYKFTANADLVVTVVNAQFVGTVQVYGTNYTVTGAGLSAGGTVTFTVFPLAGTSIVIYRDPAKTQTTSYSNNDPFPATPTEAAFDKLTMITQRLGDQDSRAVRLSDFDEVAPMVIPNAAARANQVFRFNELGLPRMAPPTEESAAAAQDAADRAEAAAASFKVPNYTTVADATAARPPVSAAVLRLSGRDVVGDVNEYLLGNSGSVVKAGGVLTADGRIWNALVQGQYVNLRSLGAGFGSATDDLAALEYAKTLDPAGGGFGPLIYIPPAGYFFNSAPSVITKDGTYFLGAGRHKTFLHFNFAGTGLDFHNSGQTLSYCGFEGVSILGDGVSVQTGVKVSNVSQFSASKFAMLGFSASGSVCFANLGRELGRLYDYVLEGSIPYLIGRNPERASVLEIDNDFWQHVSGWHIVDTTTQANVLINSGCNVTNLSFTDTSWNKGAFGLQCVDSSPLPDTISSFWSFRGVRFEQPDDASAPMFLIDKSASSFPLYVLTAQDMHCGGRLAYLRNVVQPSFPGHMHEDAGTHVRFDFDSTVINPSWDGFSLNGSDNLTGLTIVDGSGRTGAGGKIFRRARYAANVKESAICVAQNGTTRTYQATVRIASLADTGTSALWPFSNYTVLDARMCLLSTAASGAALFVAGASLTKESGTTNFDIASNAGKVGFVRTSDADVKIFNNSGSSMNATALVTFTVNES